MSRQRLCRAHSRRDRSLARAFALRPAAMLAVPAPGLAQRLAPMVAGAARSPARRAAAPLPPAALPKWRRLDLPAPAPEAPSPATQGAQRGIEKRRASHGPQDSIVARSSIGGDSTMANRGFPCE